MTPKLTSSSIAVWARSVFPKAPNSNTHRVDYHTPFFSPSQQQRLGSTVAEHQTYGFYNKNHEAPEGHHQTSDAWSQGVCSHPTTKFATVIAGTSAAFWLNHDRKDQGKWQGQQLSKELAESPKDEIRQPNRWLEKTQMLGDCFMRLSVLLDGTCPRKHVYMMGVMPETRITAGHEPLTPPLTPDNSPPENTVNTGKDKQAQNSQLESAIFDFESFINRNLARAENITGLYYARHAEWNPKNHNPKPNYTPAHFFHLASEKSHTSAQFNLALCYHHGKGGVEYVDLHKAIQYYTLAASDGHKMAQYNLGLLYQKGGKGIAKDFGLGLTYLQKAAEGENGYLPAKLAIALTLKHGVEGIPKDIERAKEIMRCVIEESDRKIEVLKTEAASKASTGASDSDSSIANPILELTSISSAALAKFYLDSWSSNNTFEAQTSNSVSMRYHITYLSHPHSQSAAYNLGVLYDRHLNNLPLAVKCYKLAVHLGAINKTIESSNLPGTVASTNREDSQCVQNAMWNLGIIYAKGKGGMQRDLETAKKWFDSVQVKDQEMRKVIKWLEKKMEEKNK